MSDGTVTIKRIVVWICEPCLNGEGEMCNTPGCALCRHKVDLPIDPGLYIEVGAREDAL